MGSPRGHLVLGITPRRWRVVAVALAIALVAWLSTTSSQPASAVVPTLPGWNLVFADDFNGAAGALPSSNNWIFDLGTSYPGGPPNWGTGEIEVMTNNPANVSTDGTGNLRITPIRGAGGGWTSARIETRRNDFQPPPNGIVRIQSRLQMPNVTGAAAAGYWPAFWALGGPFRDNGFTGWPGVGEFDIMENVQGLNQVWGVLHCGTAPGGPCNENTGIGTSRVCPGAPCQGNFHTYRFEWDRSVSPNQLRWYVDDIQYHSVSQAQLPAQTWTNMTNHGYMLILNVAMGGGFPAAFGGGPTAQTASGVPMIVDYVAVYTQGGGTTPTTSPTTTPTTTPTSTTQPPGGGRNAYARIEAESFNAQNGTQTEGTGDAGGGQNVGFINNGNWLRYDGVNFGSTPARQFVARVASGAGGGVSGLVQVRLDNINNPPIGSFAIANTGGWQSWRTVPANISAVTGTHTVFLTFSSGQPADFVNVNWFNFGT